MAWNHYYIFVKAAKFESLPVILDKLNLSRYQPGEEVALHMANKPTTLFAGFFNDNLLLVHQDIVFDFFQDEPSETEKRFIQTFPNAEIAVLIMNETVSLFSFAIIINGEKTRMKDGCDGTIYHDIGELLPEEREILAGEIFEEDELDEMRDNGMGEDRIEAMINCEVGYRAAHALTGRYLGEEVSQIDTDKVRVTKYY